MNPIINNNPTAPQMPEPDNPLKVLKPILILAIIALIGWQVYTSFSSWLTENNMTFEDFIAMIDEEEYDDEDDAVEDRPEKTPVDVALENYLSNSYNDTCVFKDRANSEVAGYTTALFTCTKVIGHDVFAYGKFDENDEVADAHDGYLYSYFADDVRNILSSANLMFFPTSDTSIADNDEQVSNSLYMSNINHANYLNFVHGYEHTYNFNVEIDAYTDEPDSGKVANITRLTCGTIPNYTATYYFNYYRSGGQVKMTANCNNGKYTVE